MSKLEPLVNGWAEIGDGMYFVKDVVGLRHLINDLETDEDAALPVGQGAVDANYVANVIFQTAQLPFPRIVIIETVFACRADGCRNGEDDEDYLQISYSFGLLDTIDLTAQFSLRGYS